MRPPVSAMWWLLKLGSDPRAKTGDRDPSLPDGYISNGWLPGPWERHPWLVEGTSQKDRVRIYSCLLSQVNAPRKRRLAAIVPFGTNSKSFWPCWAFSARHFKGPGMVKLGTGPGAEGSYAKAWSGIAVCMGRERTPWSVLRIFALNICSFQKSNCKIIPLAFRMNIQYFSRSSLIRITTIFSYFSLISYNYKKDGKLGNC